MILIISSGVAGDRNIAFILQSSGFPDTSGILSASSGPILVKHSLDLSDMNF